jgi:transposase
MRRIKEVLRLAHLDALSERQIARGANMKKSTVHEYLLRAHQASITWAEAQAMSDEQIDHLLFPPEEKTDPKRVIPAWPWIHTELRRKHVTLQLLWEEYRDRHSDGYGYSRFCELYRDFTGAMELSMRQTHVAGEKAFVDYSGDGIEIVDAQTGEARMAQVFVAVLGASNYTYAEATWTQGIEDWIGSQVRMLMYFGGVPAVFVPDNLKTGVTKACYYDPVINPTYQSFAEHYGVAILPARIVRPKDKAKVESGVQVVQRWILARLRNLRFFSLGEANAAIADLLEWLNNRPFKKLPGTRRSLFELLDKPALRPLPAGDFELPAWKDTTVNIDYHVVFEDHAYSVPFRLARERVTVRSTATVVEVLHHGRRIAVHARSRQAGGRTTNPSHMPPAHHWQDEHAHEHLLAWGRDHGAHIAPLFERIIEQQVHPEQGSRACIGIKRLSRKVGDDRLDAACRRALVIGGYSYRCVRTILERGQDRLPLPDERNVGTSGIGHEHENIRGARYYRDEEVELSMAESTCREAQDVAASDN